MDEIILVGADTLREASVGVMGPAASFGLL